MNSDTQLAVSLHILTLLAYGGGERMTSEFMASSVNTNPVVIRRTLGKLRRAGFVRSRSGKQGGWELTRKPEEITLREVMAAVRTSPVLALRRESPNPACPVGANLRDVLLEYYARAEDALLASLGEATIADLAGRISAAVNRG